MVSQIVEDVVCIMNKKEKRRIWLTTGLVVVHKRREGWNKNVRGKHHELNTILYT